MFINRGPTYIIYNIVLYIYTESKTESPYHVPFHGIHAGISTLQKDELFTKQRNVGFKQIIAVCGYDRAKTGLYFYKRRITIGSFLSVQKEVLKLVLVRVSGTMVSSEVLAHWLHKRCFSLDTQRSFMPKTKVSVLTSCMVLKKEHLLQNEVYI